MTTSPFPKTQIATSDETISPEWLTRAAGLNLAAFGPRGSRPMLAPDAPSDGGGSGGDGGGSDGDGPAAPVSALSDEQAAAIGQIGTLAESVTKLSQAVDAIQKAMGSADGNKDDGGKAKTAKNGGDADDAADAVVEIQKKLEELTGKIVDREYREATLAAVDGYLAAERPNLKPAMKKLIREQIIDAKPSDQAAAKEIGERLLSGLAAGMDVTVESFFGADKSLEGGTDGQSTHRDKQAIKDELDRLSKQGI